MPNTPIVIAHRGASGYLPEHTLEAKALAYGMEADFLEQDLVLSRDGVLVVIHDIYLETVTNVAGMFPNRHREDEHFYAIDFDWAELEQLEVHERVDPKTNEAVYPNRYPVGTGTFRLHRFEDEITLIQGLNQSTGKQVGIYPEIKKPAFHRKEGQDISQVVLKSLTAFGYKDRDSLCFLQCFDQGELIRIRSELGSQLRLIQLIGENVWKESDTDNETLVKPSGLEDIASYADGIGPSISRLHTSLNSDGSYNWSSLVPHAHNKNLQVHPYTFRKETIPDGTDLVKFTTTLLQRTQIDGFFTDFPDLGKRSVENYMNSRQ